MAMHLQKSFILQTKHSQLFSPLSSLGFYKNLMVIKKWSQAYPGLNAAGDKHSIPLFIIFTALLSREEF